MENKTNSPIYWTLLTHEDWNMLIAATSIGLCYVGSQNQPFEELAEWTNTRFPDSTLYSDIAHQIQRPAAVRAVCAAIGANPILITVPCHRVIGKNGALTGYRGGMDMKTKLLQLEQDGVLVEGGLQHA